MQRTSLGDTDKGRSLASDVLVLLLLLIAAALAVSYLAAQFPPEIYYGFKPYSVVWYGADQPRVFGNMTDLHADNSRSVVHPIFSILLWLPNQAIAALGFSQLTAVQSIMVFSAMIGVGLIYATARTMGLRKIDAILSCLVFMASASFITLFGVVETFAISAATVSAMLFICAVNPASPIPWIIGSAANLSITTTNWTIGLLATWFSQSRWRFLKITLSAFLLVLAIAAVQKLLMPTSVLFLSPFDVAKERQWTNMFVDGRGPLEYYLQRILNLWIFTGVNPAPVMIRSFYPSGEPFVYITNSRLHELSLFGIGAALSWLAMLALGLLGMTRHVELRRLSIVVFGYLLFQTLLHLFYGDEPFLYSLHFLPAMIIVVSFGFIGPARTMSRIAAAVFIVTALVSNQFTFREAMYRVHAGLDLGHPYDIVQAPRLGDVIAYLWSAKAYDMSTCMVTSVTVVASGTSYEGAPIFQLIIDGQEMGERTVLNAPVNAEREVTDDEVEAAMTSYMFGFEGIKNLKQLRVRFVNEYNAGEGKFGDRDFFVKAIWIGSRKYPADLLELYGDGAPIQNGRIVGLFSNGSIVLNLLPATGCL